MALLPLLFNLPIIYDYLIYLTMQPYVALCSSEELLKFGGGQKIFIFRGGVCPMKGRSENFHFQRGDCPMRGGGGNFLGGGSCPLHTMVNDF